jgi:signal peptidase
VGVYLLIDLSALRPLGTFANAYVIPPVLWVTVTFIVLILPKYRADTKPTTRNNIIKVALLIGFFQVFSYCIAGLFASFGKSPYSFTPVNILLNLVLVVTTLIGMELSRAWLINHLGKKHIVLALAFVAVLYTLLSMPLSELTNVRMDPKSINSLNSTVLPLLTENLLASFLALLAGPLASIAYRGIMEAFWWFSPILPDLSWSIKAFTGTVVPIIGMVMVNSLYSTGTSRFRSKKQSAKEGFPIGWIIISIFCVVTIWFSVGLFPFHPSLVGSGSMEPAMYTGDIVIIAKIPADVIEEGDIIQFRHRSGTNVMHRVIEIQETNDSTLFVTKGDNNDEPDEERVIPQNVVGKVLATIPKIGWIAVVIKSFFTG